MEGSLLNQMGAPDNLDFAQGLIDSTGDIPSALEYHTKTKLEQLHCSAKEIENYHVDTNITRDDFHDYWSRPLLLFWGSILDISR